MARVLGLDLGSHAVKAVIVETNYRGGGAVKTVTSVPLPADGERHERLRAALAQLAQQHLVADSVTVAMPGTALATHPRPPQALRMDRPGGITIRLHGERGDQDRDDQGRCA